MAQGPRNQQGPQKCFVVAPEEANQSLNPVLHRQLAPVPANTRLQIARNQPNHIIQKPIPVRVAVANPITAQPPRLKHAAIAPVPTEDVKRRKMVEAFNEIWPSWSIPIGIRSPYSPAVTRLLGAMLRGEVVGKRIESVDLVLPFSAWKTQKGDITGCFRTCLRMIGKTNEDAPFSIGISMVVEKNMHLIKTDKYNQGIEVINYYLSKNAPIIVGVNTEWGSPGNHDKTTDHFVVVVGSGIDNHGNYYRFFDPGSFNISAGTSVNNKLYYDKNNTLYQGESQYHLNHKRHKQYTLTWVRKLNLNP